MNVIKTETETTIVMSNEEAQTLRNILGLTCYDTARQLADGDHNGEVLIDRYINKLFSVMADKFPNSTFDF